jgi:AcrR family transcriptional regulator
VAVPTRTRGDQRREELVAVGRQILVEEGLEAFGMRRIAERAGMRVGNLQYYFPTRDDLLEAVARAEFERDLAAVREPEDDPECRLSCALRVLLAGWSDGGGSVFGPMSLLALHHERFATLRDEIYVQFYGELAAIVRAIDPSTSRAEATTRAVLITALVDGTAVQLGVVGPTVRARVLDRMSALAVAIARGS